MAHPDESIRDEIFGWRKRADRMVYFENGILIKAEELVECGLSPKDALHVACACKAQADFFLTVDHGILKKGSRIKPMRIMTPIAFIHSLEQQNED